MDLDEVKTIIKSLLTSSANQCTLKQLLSDFYNETGSKLPTFKYSSEKSFLMSLTDTVKVTGKLHQEKVTLLKNQKSSPALSIVNSKKICIKKGDKPSTTKLIEKDDQIHFADQGRLSENGTNNDLKYDKDKFIKETSLTFKEDDMTDFLDISLSTASSSSDLTMSLPDSLKMKLKKLIGCQTRGIWCCELPRLYNQFYNTNLEYKEYGFRSLIEMVMSLNEIFRTVRPHNEDWLLFDASKPFSQEEKSIHLESKSKIPDDIEKNVIFLLERHFEKFGNTSIEIGDFLILYFVKYGVQLEFRKYGFSNIKDFMNRMSGHYFAIVKENKKLFIKPIIENQAVSLNVDLIIKPDDELFHELFPGDVVRFGEKFTFLDMENYFKVSEMVKVVIADVCSPSQFYVQLKLYENDFKSLAKNLEEFYNENNFKYKMPRITLQPGQICVALIKTKNGFKEWHRSKIVRANKSKVEVRFLDYGMNYKVNFEDVRFMHRSFIDLPAQCFAAKLSNVQPVSKKNWPSDACERFLELVSKPGTAFLVECLDLQNNIVCGTLLTEMNDFKESINMILVKEGMAFVDCNGDRKKSVQDGKPVKKKTESSSDSKTGEKIGPPSELEENPAKMKGGREAGERSDVVSSTDLKIKNSETDRECSENFTDNENGGVVLESANAEKTEHIVKAKDFHSAIDIPENKLSIDSEKRLRLSWTLEKEIEALAYSLLSKDQWIKNIARNNFDFGLRYAKALAEQIIFNFNSEAA